jgi:hypothetical protein
MGLAGPALDSMPVPAMLARSLARRHRRRADVESSDVVCETRQMSVSEHRADQGRRRSATDHERDSAAVSDATPGLSALRWSGVDGRGTL